MKILFFSTQLPYPPHSGGLFKSFSLSQYLSKESKLTILCNLKQQDEPYLEEFKNKFPQINLIIVRQRKGRSALELIKSYLFKKTLNEWRNFSHQMQNKFNECSKNTNIIIVDHYEMCQYILFKNKPCPVVIDSQNAEHIIWKGYAKLSKNIIKKILLNKESKRVKKAELRAYKNADLVFLAINDKKNILNIINKKHHKKIYETCHLGNEQWLNLPNIDFNKTQSSLLFFGTLSWEANSDAITWFIDNVWNKLKKQKPELKLYIAGKYPPKKLQEKVENKKDIKLIGFVENLEKYFLKCRIFINPIRFGSGMKVKMVDAAYRGLAIVSSNIGNESLDLKHGKQLLIANNKKEWVKNILMLLENKLLWEEITTNARKKAKAKYMWQPLLEKQWTIIKNKLLLTKK